VDKYDPDLEEIFFEALFPVIGRPAEKLARRCAIKAREFYYTRGEGVELYGSER